MKDTNKNQLFVALTIEEAAVINGGRRGQPEPGDDRGGRGRGRGKDDPVGHQ